jgi:hypothetical protein
MTNRPAGAQLPGGPRGGGQLSTHIVNGCERCELTPTSSQPETMWSGEPLPFLYETSGGRRVVWFLWRPARGGGGREGQSCLTSRGGDHGEPLTLPNSPDQSKDQCLVGRWS